MRDLIRRLLRLLRADDRGAAGALVGVVLGSGVLLGMGALVIDVGRLYLERAELQNGADAAALAVARSCGRGTCAPAGTLLLTARSYAAANATDQATAVTLVCGSGGALGACPASTGSMVACSATVPTTPNYVEVRTATGAGGTATLLPSVFARALLGEGDYDEGSTVLACARAGWGAPSTAWTPSFTISACEWDAATNKGTSYAAAPPYPPNAVPSSSFSRALHLHGTVATSPCSGRPSGSDGPGMFGWTDDDTGNCSVHVDAGTYYGDTGASASSACQTALAAARTARSVIYIPVYTTFVGGTYTLEGFAAFVVTGYSLPGFKATDWLNPSNDCKGSDKCVNGYFTRGLMPAGELPAAGGAATANLGAVTSSLAG